MNNRKTLWFGSCLILVVSALPVWGQSDGKVPDRLPLDAVAHFDAPVLDRAAIATEDVQRSLDGLPPRFAIPNPTSISPATHGTWESPSPSTLLWRLRVQSPGATSLNFGFTRYLMPRDGQLMIHAADGSSSIRPFTPRDNAAHGELWTPPVRSDDVVIEVTIPTELRGELQLLLGSVNVGYREFGKPDMLAAVALSGSCNVDVICPEGDPWDNEIPSVGVISTGGSTFCTGYMVNNTAQDRTPFFMTANHCGISSGNAASLVVFWNYQNSTCRPVGSPASGGPGDGQLNQFQTGSFFRSSYSPSDFTLVQLDEDPDPAWNVSFGGWNRSSGESPSGTCIHHPNTDEKRISFYTIPTTTTSYNNPSVPGDGTHVHATWSLGVTEPGSSGSPLFDVNHRVIGQLHGGPSSCTASDKSDYYGRFSISWTGGGSNASRLSNWLDPGSTGATFVDTIVGGGLNVTPSDDVMHIGQAGGPFNDPTVTYTLSNPSSNPVDYEVALTANFGILVDGGTAPVTGTLAANSTVQVQVSLGPPIYSLSNGVYVETVVFTDITNTLVYNRQHTVEVGQTLFTVVPATNLDSGGPVGGPFPGSILYTVTSQRPTPVTVNVSGSGSWISLNGGAGPVNLNLNGTGDSANLTVSFSAAANSLPAGIYNGTVSFTNQSGGTGDTTRTVSLDVGRSAYPSADTPLPIGDSSTINSQITIPDSFCIGDVNVDVDISHTYIGDLNVDLVSPGGTSVRLHARTGGGTNDLVLTYDDEGTPPDGPGSLADFDFENAAGAWTLIVSDNASSDTGTLNSWTLRIAASPGNCPSPQPFYTFPLDSDPGWTRQGQWQFGVPTGAGSGNHDPTSGFTGPNVYGYNLAGDYANSMAAAQYLTTTALDFSQVANARLRYYRWLGVESSSYDHATVQVSTNGTAWTTVWQNSASLINDAAWIQQSINISAVADGQPTVYLRWGMGPTDGSATYAGWNIDDVEIWGIVNLIDCNQNGIDDATDIAQGDSLDCNTNDIPDECDVALGGASRDCNADLVPDECQAAFAAAEPSPMAKSRFISFVPSGAAAPHALRVTLLSLHHPLPPYSGDVVADFSSFEGEVRWVGPPASYVESDADAQTFLSAVLQCQPYYADWSTVGLIHVTGAEILPSSAYEVAAIPAGCNTLDEANYSAALAIDTSRWADIEVPFSPPSPTQQPDLTDVSALVNKFRNAPDAPSKVRTALVGNVPDLSLNIDFSQISACVDAFRGLGYPLAGPATCP